MSQIHPPYVNLSQPSMDELTRIWHDYEHFLVSHGSRNRSGCVHLPIVDADNDGPVCRSGLVANETKWVEKDVSIYPIGYPDVCLKCIDAWRQADD